MSIVNEVSDPYRSWLKIDAASRPLNAYQMLGLRPLEADWTRLKAAIERQRALLDSCRADAEPDRWNQIQAELEGAISTLTSTEKRSVLDASLRRRAALSSPGASSVTPPAETPPGTIIVCQGCQKENPGQRRFCSQCGNSLWERCNGCGTAVAIDERFCGQCGVDVRSVLSEQQQALEQKLITARQLAAEMKFAPAISLAREVAVVEDPKLDPWAQQAVDLIDEIEKALQTTTVQAEHSFELAQQHAQNHAFENVIALLDEIPPHLRTPEMIELRKQSLSARNEILALGGEIREAVTQNQTNGLLPKIERLLILKPNYNGALKLAGQLRDKLARKALQELTENEFQAALDTLRQIPPFIRNEDIEVLSAKAEELLTLLQDLRRAPLATPTALLIGKRLLKLAKNSAAASKLVADLEQKVTQKPKNPRLRAVDFAVIAHRTTLGVQSDWLAYFTRLRPEDPQVAATLEKHPGQFFVALGLALQGIERAKLQIDLLAKPKSALQGMLSSLSFQKKKTKSAWGIDCSATGIKAIRLSQDEKGILKLTAAEFIPHSKPLNHPEVDMQRAEIRAATIKQFLEKHKVEGDRIVVALPGQLVLGRFFDLPPMAAKKIAETIQYEAKHQVPIPLDELHWSYVFQEEISGPDADQSSRRVLLLAARDFHVKDRVQQFKDAGLAVDVLTSDVLAIHNAMHFEFFEDEKFKPARPGPIMTVDLGNDGSNIVVSRPNFCWFRPIGTAGHNFTEALVKEFKLVHDQAEELKHNPAQARRLTKYYGALRPLFLQITSELERSVSSFHKLDGEEPIQQIFGIGGGFHTHGLLRQLRGWD